MFTEDNLYFELSNKSNVTPHHVININLDKFLMADILIKKDKKVSKSTFY